MRRLLSWLSSIVFFPAFGLVLVVFDVAQRIARLFGQRPQEYVAGALQWTLVHTFRICGTRLAVERSPAVRPRTSYIIVSNHQSMFDIAILGSLFFSNFPKYISKRSLGRWIPSVSYNLRHGGHVLIDRSDAPSALEAIRELGRQVRRGGASAMIFPEGTRARAGELGRFKPAGTLALLEEAPGTPVVPVAIDESWRLLQHNFLPVPWGVRVRVHVGTPIARQPGEDHAALLERVRADIAAALARWRGEPVRDDDVLAAVRSGSR
jgi:1-acyl-sn-glycerol-3-phosphate acyltransferase